MKNKKFLSIVCAFLMMISACTLLANRNDIFAADEVTRYYGSSLVSTDEGSSSISSSLKDGLVLTFKKASANSSIRYKHMLDMKGFSTEFKFSSDNFEEMWFRFTDNDNSTKWIEITFKKSKTATDKVEFKLLDNFGNKTAYKTVDVDSSAFTSETGMTLGYDLVAKSFSLNGKVLESGDIKTLSFYKNIANMKFGVKGVVGEKAEGEKDEPKDAVMTISSISNSNGTQTLATGNSSATFDKEKRNSVVIIPKAEADNKYITIENPVTKTVKAASKHEYVFPYFAIDVLGTGWSVQTKEGSGDFSEKVDSKLKHAIGNEGEVYEFKIFATREGGEPKADETPSTPVVTLNVTAVKDTESVGIKDAEFAAFINSALPSDMLVAPKEDNTYEFPHASADEAEKFLEFKDDLDVYSNVTIQIGYKAPGDTGEYNYVSSYAVKITADGVWSFRYKVTDSAGNITESKPFEKRILDNDAPTIKVSESIEISLNEKYTIASATITDNASGVDSTFTKWELYSIDSTGKRTRIEEDKDDEKSFLKDGAFTPKVLTPSDQDASYVVVYYAQDRAHNISEPQETLLKVVQGKPDYATNPWNDFFRTALIVIACLAGTGIIVLIFVKPKTEKKD